MAMNVPRNWLDFWLYVCILLLKFFMKVIFSYVNDIHDNTLKKFNWERDYYVDVTLAV